MIWAKSTYVEESLDGGFTILGLADVKEHGDGLLGAETQ